MDTPLPVDLIELVNQSQKKPGLLRGVLDAAGGQALRSAAGGRLRALAPKLGCLTWALGRKGAEHVYY